MSGTRSPSAAATRVTRKKKYDELVLWSASFVANHLRSSSIDERSCRATNNNTILFYTFFFVFFLFPSRRSRHEVDADGKPIKVNGLVITGGGGSKGEEYKEFDVVVAATDVPGIKKLLPDSFRK